MDYNAPYCYLQFCKSTSKYHLFVIIRVAAGYQITDNPNVVPEGTGFRVVITLEANPGSSEAYWYSSPLSLSGNLNIDTTTGMVLVRAFIASVANPFETKILLGDADNIDNCPNTPTAPAYNCPHVRLLHEQLPSKNKRSKCVIPVQSGVTRTSETIVRSQAPNSNIEDITTSNIVLSGQVSDNPLTTPDTPPKTNNQAYPDENPSDGHFEVVVSLNGKPRKGKVRNSNSTIQPGPKIKIPKTP